ncbi:superoxide dismutase family protein [Erythrobacter litoralis]|uniref:Superoxide dismutase [Cu-Zn] n=1 Tax=Erythrobacter litoralis (strain HTCC2594) TaxID=314225 RepID=Q2N610_ERYLH|nr:superoxide dismutase family protein [Erythrobacter litoralis]ABC64881.1 putative superoxide dismutase (Cu/Zn) [Erythrobacter litoralis HTCC2594]
MKDLPAALTATALIALSLSACTSLADVPNERVGSATFSLANGIPAGTAQLVASGDTVTLAVAVTGISPGQHGFHLHETGTCAAPDFTSAGGHLNPDNVGHGLEDDDGAHLGDLPNLTVSSSGTATTRVDLRGSRSEVLDAIFDADGTAIVIHADPDDGRTDPSGNAGKRVACAVIKPS